MPEQFRPFNVHVMDDLPDLEAWPHLYRQDIVLTPEGFFLVNKEDYLATCVPLDNDDWRRIYRVNPFSRDRVGQVKLPVKVPWGLLMQAVRFFQEVWQRYRRQDILLLYLRVEDSQYEWQHPILKGASSQGVDYEMPDATVGYIRAGSIHSHGDQAAYHSKEDEDDDLASPGVHIVVGNVDRTLPTLRCYGSNGSKTFLAMPSDIFEMPTHTPVPQEWQQEGVASYYPKTRRNLRH